MKPDRYHPASIFFHWVIFLLFVAALAAIEYRGYVPKGDPLRDALRAIHVLAGQLIFLFVLFRVAARLRFGAPPTASGPRWQGRAAQAVHGLLYMVMFALPITGVLFNQAGGREVVFFDWALPQLIEPDKALRSTLHSIHVWIGNALYYLAGLHILGALWHHFALKDNTLRRMLIGADQGRLPD
jgi:cytochrome b561